MDEYIKPQRKRVFNIPVDIIDEGILLKCIEYCIEHNIKCNNIMAVNAEKIMAGQKDKFLLECLENASFLIPDGTGATVALKVMHNTKVNRLPGADLMHIICRESAKKGYRVFIYGAKEEVNRTAVEKLRQLYPGLNIVGRCNGYVTQEKMQELIDQINNSGAQILFVALGSPKQEKWIHENLPKLNVNICQGIGGTLDTIAGCVKRAPLFFRKTGTEWIYRLILQPRRIRRHFAIWVFILKVIAEWTKRKFSHLVHSEHTSSA